MLLTVTLAPPRLVTSFPSGPKLEENTDEPLFRLAPKTAAIEPGATGAGLGAKLALLTTPPSLTAGLPVGGWLDSRVAPVGCQVAPPSVLLKTPPPWVPA